MLKAFHSVYLLRDSSVDAKEFDFPIWFMGDSDEIVIGGYEGTKETVEILRLSQRVLIYSNPAPFNFE